MSERNPYSKPEIIRVLALPFTNFCESSPYEFNGDTGMEDVDIYGPEL